MISRLYILVRTLITGSPRLLLLHSLVAIMLVAAFGSLLLWMPGNTWGFFNPCTWIFGVYAVPFLLVSLAKYAAGKGKEMGEFLPPGSVALLADHVLSVQQQDRLLLNVRETTTRMKVQPLQFTPPPTGEQMVPVKCSTCQQEMVFRVDSLQRRRQRRMQAIAIAVVCWILAAVVEYVIGLFVPADPKAGWIFYASLVPMLLIVVSGFCMAYLVNYIGVVAKPTPGHKVRRPTREDVERLMHYNQAAGISR